MSEEIKDIILDVKDSLKANSSYNDRNKKVGQYDLENNLIKIYNSLSEASRQTGITITSISYCANGIRKSGGGYLWHFV